MLRHCFPLLLLLAACSLVATATALPTAAAGASASTAGAKPQAEDSVGKHGLTAKQAVKVAIAALETVNAADVIAGALAAEGRPGMRNAQHVSTGPLPGPTLLPVPAPSVAQPSRNTMGMSVQKYRSSKVDDVDACVRYPCINNERSSAVCKDMAGNAPDSPDGRTCTCVVPNHTYQGELLGCLDVDACKKHPCAKGDAAALCKDLPGAAPDSAEGRTCSCPPGFVYINNLSGCVDVFACIENEWSELCTHPCRRVPQLSHGSFAGKCSASDATKDTVCSGSCDKGWTQGQPAPAAKCTSAGWVVEGSCKAAPDRVQAKTEGISSKPRFTDPNFFEEHKDDAYSEPAPPAKYEQQQPAHHGKWPMHHGERDVDKQYQKPAKPDRHRVRRHHRKGKRREREVAESLDLLLAVDPRLQQWLVDRRAYAEQSSQRDDAMDIPSEQPQPQQELSNERPVAKDEHREPRTDPLAPKADAHRDQPNEESEEDSQAEKRQQQQQQQRKEAPPAKSELNKPSQEQKRVQHKEHTEQLREEHKQHLQDQKSAKKEAKAKQQEELPAKKEDRAAPVPRSTEQKQEPHTQQQDKHPAADDESDEPQQQEQEPQQQQQQEHQHAAKHPHTQKHQQHAGEAPERHEKHEKPEKHQHHHRHQQQQEHQTQDPAFNHQHGQADIPKHSDKHAAPHPLPAPGSSKDSSSDSSASDVDEIEYVYEEEEEVDAETPVPTVKDSKTPKQAQQVRDSEQEVIGDSQDEEETQTGGKKHKQKQKQKQQQKKSSDEHIAADQDEPHKPAADDKQASDAPKKQPTNDKKQQSQADEEQQQQQEPELQQKEEQQQQPKKSKKKAKQVDSPAADPEPAKKPSDSTAAKQPSEQQQQQQRAQEDNKKQQVKEAEEQQETEEEEVDTEEIEAEEEADAEADQQQQQKQKQQQQKQAKAPTAAPSQPNPKSQPQPQQQQQQKTTVAAPIAPAPTPKQPKPAQQQQQEADEEVDVEYEEEAGGEVQGEEDDEVATVHSGLQRPAAVLAKISGFTEDTPAAAAAAAAEKPTIQHQQKMLLHGHLRRQPEPQQQPQQQQQQQQRPQQQQQQQQQQATQQATQGPAIPPPMPLRRRFKTSTASTPANNDPKGSQALTVPSHLRPSTGGAAATAAPAHAETRDQTTSVLSAPLQQQQQQHQQQQQLLLMKHTQDVAMLPLMQQDHTPQQQQQQQVSGTPQRPVRVREVAEDAHPDDTVPHLVRRKPANQLKQQRQQHQQQLQVVQDQYGVLRQEMVDGLMQMPTTAVRPTPSMGTPSSGTPQIQQRRRPHIAPAFKQVASSRRDVEFSTAASAPANRPIGGQSLAEALEGVEEEIDGGLVSERQDVLEAQVTVAAAAAAPATAAAPAAAVAEAAAAAAAAVSKPSTRSLLSTEFVGGLFSVPSDSATGPQKAASGPKGTFKIEDFPDLGNLNSMLDTLGGSGSAGAQHTQHSTHTNPAPVKASLSLSAASSPGGSQPYSRTLAAQALKVRDTAAQSNEDSIMQELSMLGLDDIAADVLSTQPIKRHKRHQEPEEDPRQHTADRQHREYDMPAPKHTPQKTLGEDTTPPSEQQYGQHRNVPPQKQYAQPEPKQYQQQYSLRSPEQHSQKWYSGAGPEQEQPENDPPEKPDSSLDYKPRRLNRPWRNMNSDGSQHHNAAPSGPSYDQGPKSDRHAYDQDADSPEASTPPKSSRTPVRDEYKPDKHESEPYDHDLSYSRRNGPSDGVSDPSYGGPSGSSKDSSSDPNYRGSVSVNNGGSDPSYGGRSGGSKDSSSGPSYGGHSSSSSSKDSYKEPSYSYRGAEAADGLASKAHELMSKASQALKGRQQQQQQGGNIEKLSKELDELSKELEALKSLEANPERPSERPSDRPSDRSSDRAPVHPHRPHEAPTEHSGPPLSPAEKALEALQKFKVTHAEDREAPARPLAPARHAPGTSGPALVFFTNTAREKAGSVTVCQWVNGRLGECYITMIPMFKVSGKNSYPQPTGLAVQRDPSGRTRVWIVDGTSNPAVICTLVGLQVVGCEERRYRGYSDGLFDARQIAVAGNAAFILAWDKACVIQCLDAKGLSQCSCILGQEHHGIFPAGLTVYGNKLYVSHNKGSNAGVMTCDFGPQGVSECIRSPDLPLNVDGGMLVHEGHMYLSYTDYNEPDPAARGGIIVCDNADHIRLNTCRYSTGKVPARGGIFGLAVHDGVMFVPQHVKSQEVSICSEVTDTDVSRCKSVFTKDADDRVAFRSPCAVAVLPVEGEMPQPPKAIDEPTSKIDLLKNY